MLVLKPARVAMRPITTNLSNQYMARKQYRGIPLTGRDANHAMVRVLSMSKKVEEKALPFLRSGKE
jgi:hypothetical protein